MYIEWSEMYIFLLFLYISLEKGLYFYSYL